MKKALLSISLLSGISAFAAPLHSTDVSSLDMVLTQGSPLTKMIHERVKKDYGAQVALPKNIEVKWLSSDNDGNVKKMSLKYALYSKEVGDFLFCEAEVKVLEAGSKYSIESEGCEI